MFGLYVILTIFFFTIGFISLKLSGRDINLKVIIVTIILAIGATFSISGTSLWFSSAYTMILSIVMMYSGTKKVVEKTWDNKNVNDKIDAFADKVVSKNKRLQKAK